MKTAVIAQPTFLPWIGYFDLADQADVLVLLDDVPFSKQSWQQRNRIRTPKGLTYLTVPVRSAGRLGQLISAAELVDDTIGARLLSIIATNYGKAPFFGQYFGGLERVIPVAVATGKLVELNCALIEWLATAIGLSVSRVRASELGVGGSRGEHVARLCESLGASHYLSPVGAAEYLLEDHAEFEERGIVVELHNYEHPTYRQQFAPFEPYACALDLVMNEGTSALEVIRSGRRPSRPLVAL